MTDDNSDGDWNDAPFQPDWVSPPGDTISRILEARELSVGEFAYRMGRPAVQIEGLIKGSEPLTEDLAERLVKVLGSTKGFWLRRELHYRTDMVRLGITPPPRRTA